MPRKKRKPKPSFATRIKNRGREGAHLGRTLWQEPRAFPKELLVVVKRSFRTLWDARGGGLYACGFVVTFVWLEIKTLIDEMASATGVGAFLSDQLMDFILRVTFQSIGNTVQAFIWPVFVIDRFDVWGIAALAILYAVFPRYIKVPLTNWLFDGEPPADDVS